MNIARRLSKVAAAVPAPAPPKPTREEKLVLDYLAARELLRVDRFPELRDRLTTVVAEIERQIRQIAARPLTPQLLGHIASGEKVWVKSGRELPFVPPVVGSWYDDWFGLDLIKSRLAVRSHPEIMALIGDTTRSPWGMPVA